VADKTGTKRGAFGWVKAHNEVHLNEMAGQLAKAVAMEDPIAPQITERGLKQAWNKKREELRTVNGPGMGKVIKWNRKASVMYIQCQTQKRNLQAWEHKIGHAENAECPKCGRYAETRKNVALVCMHGEQIWPRWGTKIIENGAC